MRKNIRPSFLDPRTKILIWLLANVVVFAWSPAVFQLSVIILMDGDHFLHLTDAGREVAEQIYEKHRFFTEMLTNAGVDPITAERDACRIEHVISESSFQRLKKTLTEKK
ncbi:metal-dependent transcriptional regulator [Ruthenibacterium lactatiformans]|uniref:metal-dependent transcriptional regulator n=1 Tax=Ruthenibacterium lactatiformans TaxID=1550024 RepID=UPI00267512FA|nr:iron dependent repressor, metal binding and dimerization domain protein [Ruthenibacterium lactatiformans]